MEETLVLVELHLLLELLMSMQVVEEVVLTLLVIQEVSHLVMEEEALEEVVRLTLVLGSLTKAEEAEAVALGLEMECLAVQAL